MGVTAFKSLANYSKDRVLIRDMENGSTREILPGTARGFDYWIPWCRSQDQFSWHHIEIEVPKGKKRYYIWQSADRDGDFVRYSQDGRYHGENDGINGNTGAHVPGVATVNGNRLIVVGADGNFNVQYSG